MIEKKEDILKNEITGSLVQGTLQYSLRPFFTELDKEMRGGERRAVVLLVTGRPGRRSAEGANCQMAEVPSRTCRGGSTCCTSRLTLGLCPSHKMTSLTTKLPFWFKLNLVGRVGRWKRRHFTSWKYLWKQNPLFILLNP